MKLIKPECIVIKKDPIIVCEEEGRKMTFNNPRRIKMELIGVDKCAIKEYGGKACDFLLRDTEELNNKHRKKTSLRDYFVELKGKNVSTAIKQLKRSIEFFSREQEVHAYIVCTKNPIRSADMQSHRRTFKTKYHANLEVYKNKSEINI